MPDFDKAAALLANLREEFMRTAETKPEAEARELAGYAEETQWCLFAIAGLPLAGDSFEKIGIHTNIRLSLITLKTQLAIAAIGHKEADTYRSYARTIEKAMLHL